MSEVRYRCVMADPPWPYENSDGGERGMVRTSKKSDFIEDRISAAARR